MPFRPVSETASTSRTFRELLRIVAAQLKYRLQFVDRLLPKSALQQFGLHVVQPDLLQLVDGDGNVHHLVGVADRLGDAEKNLAVVHLERHADAQRTEHPLDDFDQLDLAQQRPGADNVHVALVEFAVTALLRPSRRAIRAAPDNA